MKEITAIEGKLLYNGAQYAKKVCVADNDTSWVEVEQEFCIDPEVEEAKNKLVEQYIAQRYSTSQELAIQRQKETKPDEWQAYYDYCEECKAKAITTLISQDDESIL